MMKDFLKKKAIDFKLELDDESLEKLQLFYDFLVEFNAHTNLIADADEETILTKHFLDSMAFNIIAPQEKFKLLDIGSGGGFPAIVLAIVYPQSKITAVDSIGKKVNFLSQAAEKIRLNNFTAINARAEDLPLDFKNNFDYVTARAVAQLNILTEYCLPFVKTRGYFVAYKAKTAAEEIQTAEHAIKILGGEPAKIMPYSISDEMERNLVLVKKINSTSPKYPRKSGIPKKSPL